MQLLYVLAPSMVLTPESFGPGGDGPGGDGPGGDGPGGDGLDEDGLFLASGFLLRGFPKAINVSEKASRGNLLLLAKDFPFDDLEAMDDLEPPADLDKPLSSETRATLFFFGL